MSAVAIGREYRFEGGFPTPETVQRAYDDADLVRAITAYRFFYPTVSGLAIFNGNVADECVPNEVFGMLDTEPLQVGYTLNSDTPYGPMLLDLRDGPIVIELPPGPLICVAIDLNQRWILDMGLPGPDAGKGGRHLIVPPGYDGEIPEGYNVGRSTTYRVIGAIRVLPLGGNLAAANARFATIRVHPLNPSGAGKEATWTDLTGKPQDTTPLRCETSLEYWRQLHEVVDTEPPLEAYTPLYGELAALGIAKGKPFAPDERMTGILEDAARIANGQIRMYVANYGITARYVAFSVWVAPAVLSRPASQVGAAMRAPSVSRTPPRALFLTEGAPRYGITVPLKSGRVAVAR